MKYQVEYSATAIRDLDRIWNEVFEASKDYDTTQKYLDDLMDKVEAKSDCPKSGTPLYYEDLFTGYYFVVFKAYMAFYRVEEDRMLVDRVLFAASDYMRCLHLGTDQ
ncbi:type II toxin-antitoxin system RelE/ParE family toxin [Chordicoccus furentiruminis]|jgi:plasmid stabilization system protein ParE|uniref:type II toxin-antitoxin system RelE/ParE family toxin n=1 Tax=Chordicoccus furentiruminis TaxID=2709410 RepID=UPI0023A7B9C1|nr:type II toxin-antitoxin system RelE/ParE family toxin [Chordicoccus furentiruminis]